MEEIAAAAEGMLPANYLQGFDLFGGGTETKTRSLIVTGEVGESLVSSITKNLLSLSAEDPEIPITMYINTYGGSAYDMFAIYDVMNFVETPIYTVGYGKVMSAGVLLLAAGEPGHRFLTPNASVMIHRMKGGVYGGVADWESEKEHFADLEKRMAALLKSHSKLTQAQLKSYLDNQNIYLNAKDAKKYGIVDHVKGTMPKILKG